MNKGMILFLYIVSLIWTIIGVLIVLGAWNESEKDYEKITGKVSQPLELSYDDHDVYVEQRVVMAKIYLEEDSREYVLRGKLYQLNVEGMESIQVGDTLNLMVKKTSFIGGFKINSDSKSASISGIYRWNGETIVPLEKGIAQSKIRLLVGIVFLLLGLIVGVWTSFNS